MNKAPALISDRQEKIWLLIHFRRRKSNHHIQRNGLPFKRIRPVAWNKVGIAAYACICASKYLQSRNIDPKIRVFGIKSLKQRNLKFIRSRLSGSHVLDSTLRLLLVSIEFPRRMVEGKWVEGVRGRRAKPLGALCGVARLPCIADSHLEKLIP